MKVTARSLKSLVVVGAAVLFVSTIAFRNPSSASGAPVNDAATLYKSKCASCHAADGSGNTPAGKGLKVRDLRSAQVQGQSDAQLYNVIAKGKGKMPGYEKSLGADKCKMLVAYVRRLGGR